jgi:hypothetical protein
MLGVHKITHMIDTHKVLFLHTLRTFSIWSSPYTAFLPSWRQHPQKTAWLYSRYIQKPSEIRPSSSSPQIHEANNFMSKTKWTNVVKRTVQSVANTEGHNRMLNDTDFKRFRSTHNSVGPAIVWIIPSNTTEFKCMNVAGFPAYHRLTSKHVQT